MSYKYRWSIERVDGYPQKGNLSNVAAVVYWELEVRDWTDGSVHYLRASTELDSPDPKNFVDYLELSQEELLQWVWQKADRETVEKMGHDEMYSLQHPETRLQTLGMPWMQNCCPDGTGMDQMGAFGYEPPTTDPGL